jgi:hypothetical protein
VYSPTLRRIGWTGADNLVPWKAKLLLQLGLTVTRDPSALPWMFETH